MGAAAGVGGAVEVEGGVGGLRGRSVPAWGGLVADGVRPPQAIEESPVETRMPQASVLTYYLPAGLAVMRVVPGGES